MTQRIELGQFFSLTLLQQAKPFVHDFAGVLVPAGDNQVIDDLVHMISENDISRSHVVLQEQITLLRVLADHAIALAHAYFKPGVHAGRPLARFVRGNEWKTVNAPA
ncbi:MULTISPECIES: hypothetical protein [unclassified Pseudomonas]|uniref:hypothetical protein n=1 Tax=unclassified Pseudomonas TaxID=196821 RepID=UPI00200DDE4F|nr:MULTISPECIES: hypothetical protein [unclassified Pseudomonas]